MTAVSVISPSGQDSKTVELPEEIFAAKVNVPLIHQVVVAQQAAARQGTASAKTRAQVRGGGKKPYRQKGTGRARQGSLRAPQYAGGGVSHGPVPRSYVQRTPKKMKDGRTVGDAHAAANRKTFIAALDFDLRAEILGPGAELESHGALAHDQPARI